MTETVSSLIASVVSMATDLSLVEWIGVAFGAGIVLYLIRRLTKVAKS